MTRWGPVGQEHNYHDHINERAMWDSWFKTILPAFTNEPLAPPNVATYRGHEGEFRLHDMEVEMVGFEAYFHGNDHYIEMPILYIFMPEQWRLERIDLLAVEAATKKAALGRAEVNARERRRKLYEELHEEFGEPQHGIEPCTVPGCPGWV